MNFFKKYFVFEWNKSIGLASKPYLHRWRADFYLFSFRVHKWMCSDDQRAFHSHPVSFINIGLKGKYEDVYLDENSQVHTKIYKAPFIRIVKRNYRHYVHIIDAPTWTLFISYNRPKKWAFWLKETLKRKNRDKYFLEEGHHVCDR